MVPIWTPPNLESGLAAFNKEALPAASAILPTSRLV